MPLFSRLLQDAGLEPEAPSARGALGESTLAADPNGGWVYQVQRQGRTTAAGAELFFDQEPELDPVAIGLALSEAGHAVGVKYGSGGGCIVEFEHVALRIGDVRVPARVFLEAPVASVRRAEYGEYTVRITEENNGMVGGDRLQLLATVVTAAIQALKPDALYWTSAETLVELKAFVEATRSLRPDRLALLVTSVRQTQLGGGRWVVETLGLADFDLPDVQVETDTVPREALLAFVQATANTLWKRGLFAQDGEELGTGSAQSTLPVFSLHYEYAALPPAGRVVLALRPTTGPGYFDEKRDRLPLG